MYIPQTTAAVTINENADPDVVRDFTKEINKIVPWEDRYYHSEGNSAAHLKSSKIPADAIRDMCHAVDMIETKSICRLIKNIQRKSSLTEKQQNCLGKSM